MGKIIAKLTKIKVTWGVGEYSTIQEREKFHFWRDAVFLTYIKATGFNCVCKSLWQARGKQFLIVILAV
jgi:hypothetical protein